MSITAWLDLIARAGTEREVISIIRDYVATLTPQEIAGLPAECVPGKLLTGDDVSAYAFDVLRYGIEKGHSDRTLDGLWNVIADASSRLASLSSVVGRDGSATTRAA